MRLTRPHSWWPPVVRRLDRYRTREGIRLADLAGQTGLSYHTLIRILYRRDCVPGRQSTLILGYFLALKGY